MQTNLLFSITKNSKILILNVGITLMKKFLTLFFLFFSTTVFAEWVAVSDLGDGTTLYVDFDSIRKNGRFSKIWTMDDFSKPKYLNNFSVLTMKVLEEVDCKDERTRALSGSFHSEHMGDGDVVTLLDAPTEWKYPSPNSRGELIWNIACGKRKRNSYK